MAQNINTKLGFDKEIENRFVFIKEEHGIDGSFLMASLMQNALSMNSGLCLLSLHNSSKHYQYVGNKLGFSLQQSQENGHAVFIDIMKCIINSLNGEINNFIVDFLTENPDEECLRKLYSIVQASVTKLKEQHDCVYLIIDNISDLLSLGHCAKDIITFVYYCRVLLFTISGLVLVICAYNSENDKDTNLICSALMHAADYKIKVSGLVTGFSPNITGRIEAERRDLNLEYWTEKKEFLYKLGDRQIKLFAPGSVTI